MTKFEDNLSPYLTIVEATEPSAPSAGQQRLYIDSTTHLLKATNSSGTDRTLEGAASGAITSSGLTQATARLLGRTTASTGAIEEITVGTGLSLAAGSLTATASGGVGTSYPYPSSFTGDTINGSSTTPFVDVSAFDVKDVLNSRILHLRTLGASKDQRVRVTLGTTKAGAFDVAVSVAFSGYRWSGTKDVYMEVRLSTSADAQLCIARIYPTISATTTGISYNILDVGGSGAMSALGFVPSTMLSQRTTLRFVRDGSNVISPSYGVGDPPIALGPFVDASIIPVTFTVSGTLARVEFAIHTPSGPSSTSQFD